MDLTVREWEQIGRSPVLVFLAVAKADEKITDDEVAVFAEQFMPKLLDFQVAESDHGRAVFQWAVTDAARNWQSLSEPASAEHFDELERTIHLIESRFSTTAAGAWKAALRALGEAVAQASTGPWGMAGKINAKEQDVLRRLDNLLVERPVL